jgi:hypothetical protein
MAAGYSADITVNNWQSKLFLAEITVYNRQHKMAACFERKPPRAQLAIQDGC